MHQFAPSFAPTGVPACDQTETWPQREEGGVGGRKGLHLGVVAFRLVGLAELRVVVGLRDSW